MDNRDFMPYMKVAKLPECLPIADSYSVESRSTTWWSGLKLTADDIFTFCYKNLHDMFFSTIFGCLTLDEQLYIAVHENNTFKARELLIWGARPCFIPWDAQAMLSHFIRDPRRRQTHLVDTSLINSVLAMDSMLYMAVSNNNFPLVKELTYYHNYGSIDQHSEVVSLCLAVERGELEMTRHLIEYGKINPNQQVQTNCKHCKTSSNDSQRFKFPLYHACRRHHWSLIKYLIENQNCDVNQLTSTFESCLHGAILGAIENLSESDVKKHQCYQIVNYLLVQTQCNPNLGLNPLCISLLSDSLLDYTNLLLRNGCNVDRIGWNMFESSTRIEHRTNCKIRYPLDHPLNICLQQMLNLKKDSSLNNFYALRSRALSMIERRANIYAMFEFGSHYPLILAVRIGDKILIEKLVENCFDSIRFELSDVLIEATRKCFHEIVRILIEIGFSPNQIEIRQNSRKIPNVSIETMNHEQFLLYLDRCCSKNEEIFKLSNNFNEENPTAFSALIKMPSWIFHSDQHFSTIETLKSLTISEEIDKKIVSNRSAFSHALINEYFPFVYYCLENRFPIEFNEEQIEFRRFRSQNQFSFTLFHLISLCSRLTAKSKIQKILFEAFESFLSRFSSEENSSRKKFLLYAQLWFNDNDFHLDPSLFEHLQEFSRLNGNFNDQRLNRKNLNSLKQISRTKIRRQTQIFCDQNKTNLLILVDVLEEFLPKSLIKYLFYSQDKSESLINCLIEKRSWKSINWI